jgi:hypothetical protein
MVWEIQNENKLVAKKREKVNPSKYSTTYEKKCEIL